MHFIIQVIRDGCVLPAVIEKLHSVKQAYPKWNKIWTVDSASGEESNYLGFDRHGQEGDLWLPEVQKAVFTVCGDEVLLGVVGNAEHVFLVNLCEHRLYEFISC